MAYKQSAIVFEVLQSNDEPKKGHKKFYDLVVISCTVTMLGLQRNLTFNQVSWKDLRLRGGGDLENCAYLQKNPGHAPEMYIFIYVDIFYIQTLSAV